MCIAIPAKVMAVHDDGTATVSLGGQQRAVSLALVDGVVPGDYVVVHTGVAFNKLDVEEAERTLALLGEAGIDVAGEGLAGEALP